MFGDAGLCFTYTVAQNETHSYACYQGTFHKHGERMKKTALSLMLFGALGLAGCGQDSAMQLDKGMKHMASKDYRAASIEFKAVLQNDRQNLLARLALAELHHQVNDMPAEEKELAAILASSQALQEKYGIDKVAVTQKLARVYVRSENVNQLLDMDDLGSPEIRYLKTLEMLQGTRTANGGFPEIAEGSPYAYLQKVAIQLVTDAQAAQELLNKPYPTLNTSEFRSDDAMLSYAVAAANRDNERALKHLATYVDLNPYDTSRMMQLSHMYISTGQYEKATTLVDALFAKYPRHPLVNEMKAILLYQEKKYEEAIAAANTASLTDPNAKMARIIAAYSAYQTGKNQQALAELEQVAPSLNGGHPAKRLYIQLRAAAGQGRADDLVNDALALTDLTQEDVSLLSQMGLAMAQQGKVELAKKLEEKAAAAADPANGNAAALGMLQLSIGDKEAFKTLEAGLQANSASIEIGNTLASAYLASNKLDDAWRVSEAISATQPVQSSLLKAVISAQKGNHAAAVEFYNQVLSAQAEHQSASAGLVESLVAMQRFDESVQLLTRVKPIKGGELSFRHYLGAMKREGRIAEGSDTLHRLISTSDSPELQLINAQAFFVVGDWDGTLSSLSANKPAEKYNEFWLMKVGALMQKKDQKTLSETYAEWLKAMPGNQMALMGHVSALVDAKRNDEAVAVLDAHQKYHQEKTPILLMKFHLQVMARNFNDAKVSWESLPTGVQQSVVGQGLSGILDVVAGKFDAAIPKLQELCKQAPSEQYVSWLYFAYEGKGDVAGGIRVLKAYISENKEHTIAQAYLGNAYAQTGQFQLAKTEFLQVIQQEPENTLVLNNLAFVMIETGDYAQAEVHAKQALKHLPGNESVVDTLANAVLKQGRTAEAAALLSPFVNGNEEDSTGITHLKILNALGKAADAQKYYDNRKWRQSKPEKSAVGF